jgi:hypothetical protein
VQDQLGLPPIIKSDDDFHPDLFKNTIAVGKKVGGNDYADYALVKRTRRKKILKTKDNVKESHGKIPW